MQLRWKSLHGHCRLVGREAFKQYAALWERKEQLQSILAPDDILAACDNLR